MYKKIMIISIVSLSFIIWLFNQADMRDKHPIETSKKQFKTQEKLNVTSHQYADEVLLYDQTTATVDNAQLSQASVINTMAALINYLNDVQLNNINLRLIIDYINRDDEAFNYLQTQYFETTSDTRKAVFLHVIDASSHTHKTDFALQLIHSTNPSERQSAITLLNKADGIDITEVNSLLLDVFHTEEDNEVLATLLLTIDFPDAEQDPQSFDFVISRLNTLIFDAPENIAALALVNLARLQPNDETLEILTTQMQNSQENMQLAAIKGLYNYKTLPVEIMDSLYLIKDNQSIDGHSKPKINNAIVNLLNIHGEQSDADEDPNQDE